MSTSTASTTSATNRRRATIAPAGKNTSDARHVPDFVQSRLNSPACDPPTAAEELAAATTIIKQRADLWTALASLAAVIDEPAGLSSACVVWAAENDVDDEYLIALAACAATLNLGGPESFTVRRCASSLKRSKDRFVERNLRLVVARARAYGVKSNYALPMADLIQEGSIGLMKAVCRFDPARGLRFSTMAAWWIDHHIGRAVAEKARAVRLPVHVVDGRSKITKAIASLAKAGIDNPTDVMISRECTRRTLTAAAVKNGTPLPTREDIERGMVASRAHSNAMTPKRVAAVREAMDVVTISASTPVHGSVGKGGEDDQREVLDFMSAVGDMYSSLDASLLADERIAIATAALGALHPTPAAILRLRFGIGNDEPRTLKEIGADASLGLAVCRERIRQVQNKGLAAARDYLNDMEIGAGDVAWAG